MIAFINGTGAISPQMTHDNSRFLEEIRKHNAAVLKCIEPDYKKYIKPIQLRRMSRSLRMGVTSAGICLHDASVDMPDAIITGTGLGMMEETEKFLTAILDNGEKFLTPTSFIQSTHNTVGAHIAVMLKCNKYNQTYVHDNISFECAMLDALMKIDEHKEHNILVGGIDEMTDSHFRITTNAGYWRKNITSNLKMLENGGKGTIPGEGSVFFMLSGSKGASAYAMVNDVHTFYKPEDSATIKENIIGFLKRNELDINDIDLFFMGYNGERKFDEIYDLLQAETFRKNPVAVYKHLCGEYYTSSSFAAWAAANILKRQTIPDTIHLESSPPTRKPIRNILIYNHYQNINHSLILLSQC